MNFKVSNKTFIHVDCDSFFASCEILRNPKLKGKYVCVGSDIIVACSYKAKAKGIKVGTPIWEAKKILNSKGIFFDVDINYYKEISNQFMQYLKENTLEIEPFSIDEAFCEISGLEIMNKMDLYNFAKKIQNEILNNIGIPVSIGVSNTRIKAKIFSKVNKPFGICVSEDKSRDKEIFSNLPLSDIPFIGPSYQNKLRTKAMTIYDFIGIGYWELKNYIGKNATDLWLELVGVNATNFKKKDIVKSMSRTRSFNKNLSNNKQYLKSKLLNNFNKLYPELLKNNLELKVVGVYLRDKEFKTYIFNQNIGNHTYLREKILKSILYVFEKNIEPGKIYRSTGVIFSKLRNYKPMQMSIFDIENISKCKSINLQNIINKINSKYEKNVIGYSEKDYK